MDTITCKANPLFLKFFPALALVLICLPVQAQNIDLSNLFFSPVPVSMADNSVLNAGGPSEEDRDSAERAIPDLEADVQQLRQDAPQSQELIDSLTTLGLAYQTLDNHEEATEVFNEAISISEAINGEDSVDVIPLIEQSILSYLDLGQISEVTEREEHVYSIYEQNFSPDSAEMYNATINLADWLTAAYFKQAYITLGSTEYRRRFATTQRTQRQLGLDGFQGIADGSVREVGINDVIDERLRQIDGLYSDFQESYSSNTTLNVVVDIARRIARLAYHAEQEMDYERENNISDPNYVGSRAQQLRNSDQRRDESYDTGRLALQYVVDLIRAAEGVGAQQLTLALLDLADWDLAYGVTESARELYLEAYQVLIDEGFNIASIDAALTPQIPATMPRVAVYPATRQTVGGLGLGGNPNYVGYIDVSYNLDDLGNANDISVLGSSENTPPRIIQILESQLGITKFRPLLRAGQLQAQGQVTLRYYYSY